jgi:hydroxybutyrate-dimer hydrolase
MDRPGFHHVQTVSQPRILTLLLAPQQRLRDASHPRVCEPMSVHDSRHHVDLLSGGLGLEGLRHACAPAFADPARPTAEELRIRALWTQWRGIADLAPGGGYGECYGSLMPISGTEFHALRTIEGARHPHRVMAQVPDRFDARARCLVVSASSGSRGIYGATALAGAWGLPRGCAVAYTDKGAGTDWIEPGNPLRHDLDGCLGAPAKPAFSVQATSGAPRVAFKHAHSGDNPEADWGRHLRQAAEFGLEALNTALPGQAPFTFENTRIIATGLSNGGGAVLRAAEFDDDWLDGAVAIAPNVLAGRGRALYDYTTQAALLMPCALLHPRFDAVALARPGGRRPAAAVERCARLRAEGILGGVDTAAQAADAYAQLHASGWTDACIEAGALSVAFDLWRAVAVGYASTYTRAGFDRMPCGYAYAVLDADGTAIPATPSLRASWWSDTSGIPPGNDVGLIDGLADADDGDPARPGLQGLRALWSGNDRQARRLQASVEATRAGLPRRGLPLIVIHGTDDGLIPEAFSSAAYVRHAAQQDRALAYWRVANAQHFDAFLGIPALAARHVPLLPYAYRALDAIRDHLEHGAALPGSADIPATPRTTTASGIAALTRDNLALP